MENLHDKFTTLFQTQTYLHLINEDEWQFDPVANKKRKQQQMLAETLEAGLSSLLTAIGEVKAEPDKLPLLLKTVGDDLRGVMGEVAEVMVAIENPENVVVDEEGEVRVEKKKSEDLKKKKRKKQARVAAAGNEDAINGEILGDEEEEDEEQDSDAEDDIAEALFEIETKDFEVEHNEKLRRRSRSRSPKAGTNASSKASSRKQSPGSPHSASKSPHGRENSSSTRGQAPGKMKSKSPKTPSSNKKPVPTGGVAIPAQKKPATTTSQADTWPNPLPPKPEEIKYGVLNSYIFNCYMNLSCKTTINIHTIKLLCVTNLQSAKLRLNLCGICNAKGATSPL